MKNTLVPMNRRVPIMKTRSAINVYAILTASLLSLVPVRAATYDLSGSIIDATWATV